MPIFDFKIDETNISGSLTRLMGYMKWFTSNIDNDNVKYHAWGDSIVDNVDATHKLKLKFYIPDSIFNVEKLLLNFSLEAFRAYETGAASGGGSVVTSSSGGGSTETAADGTWSLIPAHSLPADFMEIVGAHTHGGAVASDGAHPHAMISVMHTHPVTIPSHAHGVTVPDHTHGIVYGIYESTLAAGVKVYVDGTLRLDNGGLGYSADQANLDLTQWVLTAGWHTIELSSTQLGRINAAYFIQIYAGKNGI